ncbi:flagellin [Vibrio zhanjiangensis]|uniref:Flagellin n=1 Tax=Vibrio zhanjiangensis TaxID=1046128 RepID=A0ABQ6EUK5_9VIBR|nr:flagellin [Vibrio zhanjiangensis]GLT16381.1 flagellin [Vibrio zhanjiangensis]
MAMSTIEVRPHNVALTTHSQTSISPSRSAQSHSEGHRPKLLTHNNAPASFSVSGMLLTQGQQNATSVQIAVRSYQLVGGELSKIKQGLTSAMQLGSAQSPSLQQGLLAAKKTIEQTLEAARFDGKKVIDNQLELKINRADLRRFSIPGLDINRLSDKAEQIRLDFPQGHSVMVEFDGQSDGSQVVKMLDRSLIPLGLRASLSQQGSIIFEASEKAYGQMHKQVRVTGQGHRFPAGQSNIMTLQAEPEGIAELSFDLGSREGLKRSIAKVNKLLWQTRTGLEQANSIKAELNGQIQTLHQQASVISPDQVEEKFKTLNLHSGSFSSALMALSAQANVKRHSVVALLRN